MGISLPQHYELRWKVLQNLSQLQCSPILHSEHEYPVDKESIRTQDAWFGTV